MIISDEDLPIYKKKLKEFDEFFIKDLLENIKIYKENVKLKIKKLRDFKKKLNDFYEKILIKKNYCKNIISENNTTVIEYIKQIDILIKDIKSDKTLIKENINKISIIDKYEDLIKEDKNETIIKEKQLEKKLKENKLKDEMEKIEYIKKYIDTDIEINEINEEIKKIFDENISFYYKILETEKKNKKEEKSKSKNENTVGTIYEIIENIELIMDKYNNNIKDVQKKEIKIYEFEKMSKILSKLKLFKKEMEDIINKTKKNYEKYKKIKNFLIEEKLNNNWFGYKSDEEVLDYINEIKKKEENIIMELIINFEEIILTFKNKKKILIEKIKKIEDIEKKKNEIIPNDFFNYFLKINFIIETLKINEDENYKNKINEINSIKNIENINIEIKKINIQEINNNNYNYITNYFLINKYINLLNLYFYSNRKLNKIDDLSFFFKTLADKKIIETTLQVCNAFINSNYDKLKKENLITKKNNVINDDKIKEKIYKILDYKNLLNKQILSYINFNEGKEIWIKSNKGKDLEDYLFYLSDLLISVTKFSEFKEKLIKIYENLFIIYFYFNNEKININETSSSDPYDNIIKYENLLKETDIIKSLYINNKLKNTLNEYKLDMRFLSITLLDLLNKIKEQYDFDDKFDEAKDKMDYDTILNNLDIIKNYLTTYKEEYEKIKNEYDLLIKELNNLYLKDVLIDNTFSEDIINFNTEIKKKILGVYDINKNELNEIIYELKKKKNMLYENIKNKEEK